MSPGVKRRYDNSRRQAVVRATRAAVVAAARGLFVARGYSATTIEAIAEASAVPPGTVYRLFGSKRGILLSVLDVAFGGDDEPVAYRDRPATQAALAHQDPRRLIEAFSPLTRELLERSAPILHVLRSAAEADSDAADLFAEAQRQRYAGQSNLARVLAKRGQLAVTETEAADIMYTLRSPEVFRTLTEERGWSPERYECWLTAALQATLLDRRTTRTRSAARGTTAPKPSASLEHQQGDPPGTPGTARRRTKTPSAPSLPRSTC